MTAENSVINKKFPCRTEGSTPSLPALPIECSLNDEERFPLFLFLYVYRSGFLLDRFFFRFFSLRRQFP